MYIYLNFWVIIQKMLFMVINLKIMNIKSKDSGIKNDLKCGKEAKICNVFIINEILIITILQELTKYIVFNLTLIIYNHHNECLIFTAISSLMIEPSFPSQSH